MIDNTIMLPSKPRVVSEDGFEGVFEIDGLYPGFGHTLGNSIRRIILSSLSGSAIVGIKIEGVSHEFTTMPGVREDVITMLLNLKKLRFESLTQEPQTVKFSVKGPKKVTGEDLKLPGQIHLHNPDAYICELTDKTASIDAEIFIERGLGYVPREVVKKDRSDIGEIALDAVFSPIRRVNYEVENMRVGDRTDFNRLRFIIETDGSLTPKKALEQAIEILITQLKAVVGWREEELTVSAAAAPSAAEVETTSNREENADTMKTRIEDLELSARTTASLQAANIRTVGGIVRKKESDLLEIEGLGPKSMQEIKRALSNFGITLK